MLRPVIFFYQAPSYSNRLLSFYGRLAVSKSSQLSFGKTIFPLKYDDLFQGGIYWSLSHKPGISAGVVAPCRVGIDVEKMIPRKKNLFSKIILPREIDLLEEQSLSLEDNWYLFYIFYTAKEAVLKAVGVGIGGLSKCFCQDIKISRKKVKELKMIYSKEKNMSSIWVVKTIVLDENIVSIAYPSDPFGCDFKIAWHIINQI